MRKILTMAACLALIATASVYAWTDDDKEEKVTLDKLPKAVLQAVKDRFPRGELGEASKETENGKTEYEVSLKLNGSSIDVMVSPEGKLTLIEKSIHVEDLPKAVAATVKTKHPTNKITKAEEVIKVADDKETLEYYEVIVEVDGKPVELEILLNGKMKPEVKK